MIRGKVRKELSLILIIMLIAALLTGCSDITDITLKKDGSGSYKEVLTVSKSLWTMASEAYGSDEAILAVLRAGSPQADIQLKDITEDGTACKQLTMSADFKDTEAFQKAMSMSGITSVKFSSRYFSRSAIYMPMEDSQDLNDTLIDQLTTLIGDNPELLASLTAELKNIKVQTTITFPFAVIDSNGKLQEDNHTVIWDAQKLQQDQQTRLYAVFDNKNSNSAPAYTGAVDGKNYNSGVTLNIDSKDLLNKVTVNGEDISSDYLFLSEEGVYKITAADVNGNSSKISFRIDTTKPSVKGVADNKAYSGSRTIKYSDKGSGIKNAKLNDKSIKSGTVVSKKGSYTLVVTDKAGNKKTIKFKIK